MKLRPIHVLSTLMLLALIRPADAHSDLDKPMFVTTGGEDAGRCQDIGAPCASIDYALTQAGKGNRIRVATGRYEVREISTVFHLVSGALDIRGGYDAVTGEATGQKSTLVGVPPRYRDTLAQRGFHVVADTKGMSEQDAKKTAALLGQREKMQAGLKTAPCQSGVVDGLACDRVDLLSHVPFADVSGNPVQGADVWGFVDLNSNREYAMMGYSNGTAVFDITDPEMPREVGFIDGQSTTWRDIKVHQRFNPATQRFDAFAYVTTDGAGDGLFVIDLRGLPHRVSRLQYSSDFSAAHNVFATNTDYATGLPVREGASSLIIAGSNNGSGIFRSYSLEVSDSPFFSDMPSPGETGCGSSGCYMHDAASMIIDDPRISQCPNATTYCEVLFDFNEDTFDLWDITDATNPVRLSRTPYSNSRYTHSGWPSEDKQTLFVHDELDEARISSLNTTVRTFSIADLAAPTVLGSYVGSNKAIDHNGFVRGNRYYMSNYSNGLTILDISNPASPVRIGFLDTFPASSGASFVGAWGAYPFFPSGVIAVSDIDSGLYLASDKTLDVAQGSLSFSAASYGVDEGSTANLAVSRLGGSSGPVSVDFEIVHATTGGNDIAAATGSLTWADGDNGTRTIPIDALVDGETESLEQLIVRLIAPTGGATLSAPAESNVYISDSTAGSTVEFDLEQIDVSERGFGTAVAVVHRSGSALGTVSVDFAATSGSAQAGSDFDGPLTGTLSWESGDATPRSIEFPVTDDGTGEGNETFVIALSNASGAVLGSKPELTVRILDGDGANAAPNANAGGSRTVAGNASVTLDGSGSSDPDGDSLSYVWSQTLGPSVTLTNSTSSTTSFTSPAVSSDTLLRFQLQVSDPSGLADTATVAITVTSPSSQPTSGGGGGGGAAGFWLLLLLGSTLLARHGTRRQARRL